MAAIAFLDKQRRAVNRFKSEIHEGPRLAAKQEQELRSGMVITIEPGVYLPDRFGVRIEDMVLITATGNEVLTRSPKAYIEL